jgi:hypothetical protein
MADTCANGKAGVRRTTEVSRNHTDTGKAATELSVVHALLFFSDFGAGFFVKILFNLLI